MKKLLLTFYIFFAALLFAQQKPTLFLIGDSTMANKENPDKNPEHGWGQMLPLLMTSGIEIQNHATNGRSSKSFRTEGRWDKVMKQLKKGDFVIIQFGHNDQKINDSARFTNPYTQYRANLERYVNETRAKGAYPILITSIVRRNFNENGVLVDTHKEYPLVVRMVGNDLKVPMVDLQLLTEQMEISYGPESSKKLHLHYKKGEVDYYPEGKDDDTHLSKLGAESIAKRATVSLKNMKTGLENFIK
ncbi:rhamnogalacturonan acetylesterase [Chryseobacterium carnipullorum]|uniref:Rhamnogalacturonan acetylesterase n=1 Tax=Chryseobacterium carnipullorum TaxID=1124835 RepID=A0A376DSI6_CHRCU|nr:rhamnogalacturonan acetylesterase [Chryseobacterium carnipullorum]AZA49260.1 rhamnogalacturonan acetylesterase [Chryseobacterium carnipullorum]AZA64154.1 rhamnogalacturonan acetylesterase [Chryseobacterium carnipullorum]STC94079.1 Rhamnogalacturonan acetylesterase rhgT [Chryseobacterium carnipullorum]